METRINVIAFTVVPTNVIAEHKARINRDNHNPFLSLAAKVNRDAGEVTTEGKPTREDALLTTLRDLHGIRKAILGRCSARRTLCEIDTLIDNLENHMAEN